MMSNWEKCRRWFAWVDRLPPRFVIAVATLGPIGRIKVAPGTFGSIAGLGYWYMSFAISPPHIALALFAAMIYIAVAFCDAAERRLGRSDPGCIILDEFVAMPFCFIQLGPVHPGPLLLSGWKLVLAVFVLFRFYDIAKPFGIRRLQKLPGGLGVVTDDLAAALATSLTISAIGSLEFLIELMDGS